MTAPTLIIGLGGIGSEIVSMVETKARQKEINIDNIKFVLIDTDTVALWKLKENGFTGDIIQISQNITVRDCLNRNRQAEDIWYPGNKIFNHKTLADGAGQVRAVSRLALENAIQYGKMEKLYQTISELHLTHCNPENKTLRIAIVSSLAGGTGSGIILPFAIHLGEFLTVHYPENGYNMSGFFMMPDIVLAANGDNSIERISLNSNAYATIKELDAFIQKEAGTKSDLSASILLPGLDSKEFKGAIYNFNFLFGLLNADETDSTLKTFMHYKDMMADSVFLAFCSPINELNSTREDNKFKHLAIMLGLQNEKIYKTFGSIGVAKLEYPYYEIRKYLTMLWMRDILQKEWFQYDKAYERDWRNHVERMNQGLETDKYISRRQHYLEAVKTGNDFFSRNIVKDFEKTEEGKADWQTYVEAIDKYIYDSVSDEMKKCFVRIYRVQQFWLNNLERKRLRIFARSIVGYNDKYKDTIGYVSRKLHELISLLTKRFQHELYYDTFQRGKIEEYHLEFWLKNRTGKAMRSPNAIRYLLGNIYDQMYEMMEKYKKESDEKQNELDSLISSKGGREYKRKELIKRIKDMLPFFEDYLYVKMCYVCMDEGIRYIEGLYRAYEKIFEDYQNGMEHLEDKIEAQKKELIDIRGTRRQLICCDETILSIMFEKMKVSASKYYDSANNVSSQMFNEAKNIGTGKKNLGKVDRNFWDSVLERWEDVFEDVYGKDEFNMDIITALEWQIKNKSSKSEHLKARMEEVIRRSVNKLSAPFLKSVGSSGITTICENYFHESLKDLTGDKKKIVEELLIGKSGVSETTAVDKYSIYFYQSMFGVGADEIYPFRKEGIYYKDYQRVMRYIHLNDNGDQILTPHIDRKWHRSDILPEMSKDKRDEEECNDWIALIYGYIEGKMIYTTDNKYILTIRETIKKSCQNIIEVMDVIKEFREIKTAILDSMYETFDAEIHMGNTYKDGNFYKEYKNKNIIRDIYMKYMNYVNKGRIRDEDIQLFLLAWERILDQYLQPYCQAVIQERKAIIDKTVSEFSNLDVDKQPILSELETLNSELKRRGYVTIVC